MELVGTFDIKLEREILAIDLRRCISGMGTLGWKISLYNWANAAHI